MTPGSYEIRWRFDMIGAQLQGERRHPERVIRQWFPDARRLEPVPIADCWMFDAPTFTLPEIPSYFTAIRKVTS